MTKMKYASIHACMQEFANEVSVKKGKKDAEADIEKRARGEDLEEIIPGSSAKKARREATLPQPAVVGGGKVDDDEDDDDDDDEDFNGGEMYTWEWYGTTAGISHRYTSTSTTFK